MKKFKSTRFVISIAIVAVLVASCSSQRPQELPLFLKNPIQIAESVERLELYSRPDGMSLSARDQDSVAQFLTAYARYGDGPIYMNMPSQHSAGTMQTKGMVRSMMAQLGLAGAPVQEGQYQSASYMPSPVVVSYRRLKTLPQDCTIRDHLNRTQTNQPYGQFGCSASANLAAMIDDPRQLLAPYELGAPDMRRRMTIYDKYIKGESPASQQPARQEISSSEDR